LVDTSWSLCYKKAVELILAIYESARTGEIVRFGG
jgi:hypothetical protein